jgi:hypothetical protein
MARCPVPGGRGGVGTDLPHPAFATHGSDFSAPKRVVPTSMAPVTFFLREEALWMDRCLAERAIPEPALQACLSELAWQARAHLAQYGAVFAGDLVRGLGGPAEQVNRALWELVAAGLVTADGFDSLRVLIDPRRKAIFQGALKRPRNTVGRWSLLNPAAGAVRAQAPRRSGARPSLSPPAGCFCGVTEWSSATCWSGRPPYPAGASCWACSAGSRPGEACAEADSSAALAESSSPCRKRWHRCARRACMGAQIGGGDYRGCGRPAQPGRDCGSGRTAGRCSRKDGYFCWGAVRVEEPSLAATAFEDLSANENSLESFPRLANLTSSTTLPIEGGRR